MINLKDRIALITGGSRGIGAACVRLFAKAGCNIAFTYRSAKSAADELADSITDVKIKTIRTEASDESSVNQTVKEVLDEFGKIDILVNNAGIWKYAPIEKMEVEEWEETINVNLRSVFLFTKAVLPDMRRNRCGRIINISSTAAQRGEGFYSHYAASKGAINSFTKSMASELAGTGINVNAVAPGWVITDMSKDCFSDKEYLKKEIEKIPVGRIASPEDIAGPVLFLASDFARHINGEIMNVNGGSVLCG